MDGNRIRRWLRLERPIREDAEREVEAELGFHLEMRAKQLEEEGWSGAEARARAQQEFGDVERARASLVPVVAGVERRRRRRQWRDELRQDVRYGWRKLGASRAFTTVALVTLSLGIGASAAMFSVVNGVLLRPLLWESPDRLVMVWETDRVSGTVREAASIPDYYDFRERNRSFDGMAFYQRVDRNVRHVDGEPERVSAALVPDELFPLLGVAPVVGRWIREEEDVPAGPRAALLSETYWRTRFGGDAAVLNRAILLDDSMYTVVGVMPDAFEFPDATVRVWLSAQLGPQSLERLIHPILVVARLREGVSAAGAHAELAGIAAELEAEYPQTNAARGTFVEPVLDVVFGPARGSLLVLLGGVGLLLLIACANVASLVLARGMTRAREVAVRTALGASGSRLARQFMVESVILTLAAAVLGIGVARLGLDSLLAVLPADLPRAAQVSLDPVVLTVAIGIALLIGVAFGLVPTLQARRVDVQSVLMAESGRGASAGRTRQIARSALVVAEVAVSFVLVVGAGLLVRTVLGLRAVDPGFRTDGIVRVEYQLPSSRYPLIFSEYPNLPRTQQFYAALEAELDRIPSIRSHALASHHPLAPGYTNSFVIIGRESEYGSYPEIVVRGVSPGYMSTLVVPVLEGRDLAASDRIGAPFAALLNQAAVKRYFPDGNAIGQRLQWWGVTREIVGIVGDQRFHGLTAEAPPAVYVPLAQAPMNSGSILVRADGDPVQVAQHVRAAVHAVDPELAVFDIESLETTLLGSIARERSTMILLAAFAAAALLLALIGVNGVLSYSVSQRTRELGVRVALGAAHRTVLAMVAWQGVRLALIGIAIGLVTSLAATRLLAGLLFGVTATDAATFAAVTAFVLVVSAVASWLPARRAVAIDPMHALRAE